MNLKERILAVLHHQEPDFVPCVCQEGHVPTGSLLRELRNKGLALCLQPEVVWSEIPNVRVESRVEGRTTYRTYHTPVGKVRDIVTSTSLGIGFRTTWTIEHMIKSVQNYDVVEFILKDTIYHYDPEPFLEAQRWLGDDGIVRANVAVSPLQQMLMTYLGFKKFSIDMYKHPKEFNEFYEIIEEKAEEYYKIVSDSPAEVVASWENIDGVMTSPRLFEKYCLPFYNKMGRILHQKGKIYLVHFDGRLNCLKNLIRQADIDVVESFTPPPIGDLPLREAKALWGKRIVIWTNIPQTILLLGADETKKFTRELLRSAAPGDNFILGIMEMVPPHSEGGLRAAIETVAQYGRYPVSPY
jgi:uroporphyrinogen-III decarboxylase